VVFPDRPTNGTPCPTATHINTNAVKCTRRFRLTSIEVELPPRPYHFSPRPDAAKNTAGRAEVIVVSSRGAEIPLRRWIDRVAAGFAGDTHVPSAIPLICRT